jgi:hypothetical protein
MRQGSSSRSPRRTRADRYAQFTTSVNVEDSARKLCTTMNGEQAINFHDEAIHCIVRSRESTCGKGPRYLAMSPDFESGLILSEHSWNLEPSNTNPTFRGIPYLVVNSFPNATWIAAFD